MCSVHGYADKGITVIGKQVFLLLSANRFYVQSKDQVKEASHIMGQCYPGILTHTLVYTREVDVVLSSYIRNNFKFDDLSSLVQADKL